MTRRGVLRAAGALAAAIPAVAAGTGVAMASPPPIPIGPANPPGRRLNTLPILQDGVFPVGALWPPPPSQTNQTRYQEMKDAGFNFLITGNYLDDARIVDLALATADTVGLRVLVRDDHDIANMCRWFTVTDDRSVPMSITNADAAAMANSAAGTYVSHNSFAGFDMIEDPGLGSYGSLANACNAMHNANPYLVRYVNLPPGTGPGYQSTVLDYVRQTSAQMLSFDRYPLLANGTNDGDFVNNWADMQAVGKQTGLPVWGYIQTVGFDGHRSPSADDLAWEVNTSLAYGAAGLQFFTYWTPTPERGGNFQPALIDPLGRRTQHYYDVQSVIASSVTNTGKQLRSMKSESTVHANDPATPARSAKFGPDSYVTAAGGDPVILSRFVDKSGDRWLFVANRSHNRPAKATLKLRSSSVARVAQFDSPTGRTTAQRDAGGISVSLRPGAAALYHLAKH